MRQRWENPTTQANITRCGAQLWATALLPFGLLLSRRRAFGDLGPLLPATWALLSQLSQPEESATVHTARQLASVAPFVALPLLRWAVAGPQLRALEAELASQAELVEAAQQASSTEDPRIHEVLRGLGAILLFLQEELRAWPVIEPVIEPESSSPSPAPMPDDSPTHHSPVAGASAVLQRMGELAWMETSVSRVSSASAPPAAPRVTPRGVDSGSGNLEIGLALHKWAARRAKARARKMSATI